MKSISKTESLHHKIKEFRYEYNVHRPQRGRGHVTAILFCIPSKIQTRQWFVTNYSNNCCLDCTMLIEDFTIFSLDMNFARCLVTCPLLLYPCEVDYTSLMPEYTAGAGLRRLASGMIAMSSNRIAHMNIGDPYLASVTIHLCCDTIPLRLHVVELLDLVMFHTLLDYLFVPCSNKHFVIVCILSTCNLTHILA